jgi:hypothetical protein
MKHAGQRTISTSSASWRKGKKKRRLNSVGKSEPLKKLKKR